MVVCTAVWLAFGSVSGGCTCGHSTQPLCGDMASVGDQVMSAYCQLTTQYTARRGSAESSVDDFDTCRGDVFIRAVPILRYIESQPSTGRFVSMLLYAYLTFISNFFLCLLLALSFTDLGCKK